MNHKLVAAVIGALGVILFGLSYDQVLKGVAQVAPAPEISVKHLQDINSAASILPAEATLSAQHFPPSRTNSQLLKDAVAAQQAAEMSGIGRLPATFAHDSSTNLLVTPSTESLSTKTHSSASLPDRSAGILSSSVETHPPRLLRLLHSGLSSAPPPSLNSLSQSRSLPSPSVRASPSGPSFKVTSDAPVNSSQQTRQTKVPPDKWLTEAEVKERNHQYYLRRRLAKHLAQGKSHKDLPPIRRWQRRFKAHQGMSAEEVKLGRERGFQEAKKESRARQMGLPNSIERKAFNDAQNATGAL